MNPLKEAIYKDRLLVDARRSGDCWLYGRAKFKTGYGQFRFEGKTLSAHRASYILYKGKIPSNKCVLHICDNKLCINPNHLRVGTQSENIIDWHKRRCDTQKPVKKHCKVGHSMTGKNVALYRRTGFIRECRKCQRAKWRKARRKIARQRKTIPR